LLALKNKTALTLLLSANIISGIAQGITMLAIPWYFIDVLDKSSYFGVIYGIITIATLFWGVYAGSIIDRYPRKIVFIGISILGFLFLGGVSIIGFMNEGLEDLMVAAVFCFTMFVYQIHYPSIYAFAQEITDKKDYAKINSYIEIQGQATNMIAGAIGALLLAGLNQDVLAEWGINISFSTKPWAMHEIFLLDASTYLIAIFIIAFIQYQPAVLNQIDMDKIWTRIRKGFSFLNQNRLVFHFGNASYSVFVFLLVEVHLLLPMYVNNHLEQGAGYFALAEVLYSIGALFAGIWIRKLFSNTNYISGIIQLMLLCAVFTFSIVFTKSVWLFAIYSIVLGLANSGIRIMRITYLFNNIPNEIIGRVTSVLHMINTMLRFLFIGLFSLPFFTSSNHVIWAYFIGGAFVFISIFPLLIYYKKLVALDVK
jgi:MFS transporter, DHA3 family, macrolide efflux protein